ncbi:hypothetical protein EV363DRAFT_1429810 [Boletus edulis]|nr:hypothetical protein EV363DRAFT_1429810 [Boletus edulis]
MSYSSLLPVFPTQAHFSVFPPAQPASKGFPQAQQSPSAPPAPSSFRAPAHKHAHHLHTIPPREKSTRTLIIDHMLWVHARTRFAQARAELGMTDRTGGPSSPHFRFQERPEQYDEEDEISSDGEDVDQLKARAAGHGDTHNEDEDNRLQKQDFALARSLRLRAIALEKVVSSMLDQPPPLLHPDPPFGDELQSPPDSPKHRESQFPSKSHPHTLPNGVRLRLALGTVINDLFARQAPIAPYRHHHHPPPIVVSSTLSERGSADSGSSNSSPVLHNTSPHPSVSTSQSSGGVTGVLPPSLTALASISGASGGQQYSLSSPISVPGAQGHWIQPGNQVVWNDRVRALYMEGTDPSTANSPPALRCPRHLHTGCEMCVEARQPVKAPGGPAKGRTAWGGETTSRPPQIGSGKSLGGSGGGITGWQDGSGIGSGLAHAGVNGSILRRKSKWFQQDAEDVIYAGAGAGNTRLSELIPRFLRLSALVAMELGQELGEDEYECDFEGYRSDEIPSASPVSPQPPFQARKAQSDSEASPLRPSRDWYMLFAGLLTRAALEGYLTGDWRGPDAASCLLSVGLGMSDDLSPSEEDEVDSIFEWFDPDDLPTLKEAAQIMFPSLSATANGMTPRRENAEVEFATEMEERLRRFYAIPSLTPDLSTHMEDLAWHYPAEPVERAAVRFCEVVARWRGKPELETYKKRSRGLASPTMTIESLVHSNPTSPTSGALSNQPSLPKSKRPSIEQYFIVPQVVTTRKRRRSGDEGDRFTKRVYGGVPVSAVSSLT